MADDGELVESGTFRVDRKKALERLRRFQLPQHTMFLLPWLRCAVASGATEITINRDLQDTRLTMTFDGRPFTGKELQDPYASLLDEASPETARNRHLAIGVLACLNLHSSVVTVTSGTGSDRIRLQMESPERESLDATQDLPSGDTVLEVVCSVAGDELETAMTYAVRRYQRWGTPRLTVISPIGGAEEYGGEKGEENRKNKLASCSFSEGAVRGWVAVPKNPAQAESIVELFHFGVLVESPVVESPLVPVSGAVTNDRFRLNVSQTGVVRDEEFQAVMQVVSAQSERLILQVCRAQEETLNAIRGYFHAPATIESWGKGLVSGMQGDVSLHKYYWPGYSFAAALAVWPVANLLLAEPGYPSDIALGTAFFFGIPSWIIAAITYSVTNEGWRRARDEGNEERISIRKAAHATAWVRLASHRLLHDFDKDSATPMLKALWEAPIFFGVGEHPLCMAELELQRRQLGHVSFSTKRLVRGKPSSKIVWCTCDRDRDDLEKFFPGQCRQV